MIKLAYDFDDGSLEALEAAYNPKFRKKKLNYKLLIIILAIVVALIAGFFVVRSIIRSHNENGVDDGVNVNSSLQISSQNQKPVSSPSQTANSENYCFEYFRSQLNKKEQNNYDLIKFGIANMQDEIVINDKNHENALDLLSFVYFDHPEFFWFAGEGEIIYSEAKRDTSISVFPNYILSENEIDNCSKAIENAVTELKSECNGLNDYKKAKEAYEYLIKNTTPNDSTEEQTCRSVFEEHFGKCAGYSNSYKLLLDRLGLNCIFVSGTADRVNHAWNMVQIGDDWYHVDCSWGDPIISDGSQVLNYDYFVLNDAEIFTDHVESEEFTYPKSTGKCIEKQKDACLKEIETDSASVEGLEVHFLDVGQGDAALILFDGHAVMIDGGNANESGFIYSYLKNHKIDYLDFIIASHPHEDHVGGLSGALNYAKVGAAFCSVTQYDSAPFSSFLKYLGKQGIELDTLKAGDALELGKARFDIFSPENDVNLSDNTSLVIKLSYGNATFLFTGDSEEPDEHFMLDSGFELHSSVLKVAHHGSNDATSYHFLYEVNPQIAVISVGMGNPYGHPSEKVLSRLADSGAETYRTDLNGTIIIKTDGNSFTVQTENGI